MPKQLAAEIESNFAIFENSWPQELKAAQVENEKYRARFLESYTLITTIQAWRSAVISRRFLPEAEAFFFEGQNDLLISHCLARCGSARQALKSLRSSIENFFFSLYYADHPVELLKWTQGKHRISFTDLYSYLNDHPALDAASGEKTGLVRLKTEYSTLSKAVHASAANFRMTQRISEIQLWNGGAAISGQWATRERTTITGVNLLLLHFFREELQGTKQLGLRTGLGLCLNGSQRAYAKSNLGITIPSP